MVKIKNEKGVLLYGFLASFVAIFVQLAVESVTNTQNLYQPLWVPFLFRELLYNAVFILVFWGIFHFYNFSKSATKQIIFSGLNIGLIYLIFDFAVKGNGYAYFGSSGIALVYSLINWFGPFLIGLGVSWLIHFILEKLP